MYCPPGPSIRACVGRPASHFSSPLHHLCSGPPTSVLGPPTLLSPAPLSPPPPSRALTDRSVLVYMQCGECSIVRNSYQICLCFYASLQMIKFLLYIVLSISKGHVSYHNLDPTIIPHWHPLVDRQTDRQTCKGRVEH